MNRLHDKDFSIAFKIGTDADREKFKKQATQGEPYFAVDTSNLYIAETTAGELDATLSCFSMGVGTLNIEIEDSPLFADDSNSGTEGEIRYSSDTEYLYIHDGTVWHRTNGKQIEFPEIYVYDTEAEIFALTDSPQYTIVHAKDTDRLYVWNGGDWYFYNNN